jgi:DNA-binding IclR family transcriptional regulator
MHQGQLPMTKATEEILAALVGHASRDRHAADICAQTGLRTGTVYPVLARLEALQWVESGWEQRLHEQGWPRRRYYRLSPYGLAMARGTLASARGSPAEPARGLRPAAEST